MSEDQGAVSTGFTDNFAYGSVQLTNDTYVELIDNTQNVPSAGTAPDALYVNALVVNYGSTLDLNGLNVYARQVQNDGTITGGTVQQLSAGGALALNTPTDGFLSQEGQVDKWTFYGQAGQSVAVLVDTGSGGLFQPLIEPNLGYAQVEVLDPSGNVLASAANTQYGYDVSLGQIPPLPVNGTYTITVSAPASEAYSTGSYIITEWDATAHNEALTIGAQPDRRARFAVCLRPVELFGRGERAGSVQPRRLDQLGHRIQSDGPRRAHCLHRSILQLGARDLAERGDLRPDGFLKRRPAGLIHVQRHGGASGQPVGRRAVPRRAHRQRSVPAFHGDHRQSGRCHDHRDRPQSGG